MKTLLLFTTLLLVVVSSCKKDDNTPEFEIVDNLDNLAISALAYDQSNTLWIASDSGLFKKVSNGFEKIDLKINTTVSALAFEKSANTIWAGTAQGIFQIKLGEADTVAIAISPDLVSNKEILTAYIDENSNRWFGTETGFTKNSGELWQKANFKQNVSGAIVNLPFFEYGINSIGIYDGDYYFATAGNKLWRTFEWKESVDAFTGATMWDQPYNGFSISDTMYVVFIDSKGQQWFGGKEGVQMHIGHDPKSDNYSYYDELVDVNVHCIAEAPNGDIWCGTENGISIFDGENWSTSTATLPNYFVKAIAFSGNKAWIGTKMGLAEIAY